jgi:hypothetical protein
MASLAAVFLSSVVAGQLVQAQIPGNSPLPDSLGWGTALSTTEKAFALQIAQGDSIVMRLEAGHQVQPIGVSLHVSSHASAATARLADVQIYRYDMHDTITATVDLRQGRLEHAVASAFEPILVLPELQRAKTHLLLNGSVEAALDGNIRGVELVDARLTRLATGPCAIDRCIETRFSRITAPLAPQDSGTALNPHLVAIYDLATDTLQNLSGAAA